MKHDNEQFDIDTYLQAPIESERPNATWKINLIQRMEKRTTVKHGWRWTALFGVAASFAVLLLVIIQFVPVINDSELKFAKHIDQTVKPFKSVTEFQDYIKEADAYQSSLSFGGRSLGGFVPEGGFMMEASGVNSFAAADSSGTLESLGSNDKMAPTVATAERVSETNVQVVGIDEPDMVKTDGNQLYISTDPIYRAINEPILFNDRVAPDVVDSISSPIGPDSERPVPQSTATTKVVQATPVAELGVLANIPLNGDMLLVDDTLVIFSSDAVVAYSVADPKNPTQKWQHEFTERSAYQAARLVDGKIVLITGTAVTPTEPCPFVPLKLDNGNSFTVDCTSVYHPEEVINSSVTTTVLKINPSNGAIEKSLSFVGDAATSVVYVSPSNIYIAYQHLFHEFDWMVSFLESDTGKGLFPPSLLTRAKEIDSYTISSGSKMKELEDAIEALYQNLDSDDRNRLESDFNNAFTVYAKDYVREMAPTGITKIALGSFTIEANGVVPGVLLNQFSLDEYEGNLRVTTTIGENNWRVAETVNDLYVLDKDLKIIGSVYDLGEGERIYSTRFMGDVGYMVTFRQTDPFYVFDLSNPNNPIKTGELKIPGYSSYLHPIASGRILGVGEENGKTKVSLFDVSDKSNPKELSKYILDEYYSSIEETHHAFLQDAEKGVFFIPGGKGGYIFSYENDTLELKRSITNISAERAVYIDDYLYIISNDSVVVVDENSWERVKELNLSTSVTK